MKTIVLTHGAAKELDSLPALDRAAVDETLCAYAMTGRGDVKKLTGQNGFRMRVGAYRIIFDEDGMTILTIFVRRRSTTTYRRS